MSQFQFSLVKTTDDQFITVFVPGREPLPANSSHPNFDAIVAACTSGAEVDADQVADLFDIPAAVQRGFAHLSDSGRIAVEGNHILLDGDPIHNSLTDQILAFMDEGEDFAPLVKFYEKLLTNPLGDVREGLFDWIVGQTADGSKVTITEDGDLIGYKGVWAEQGAYRPSTPNTSPVRVNGVEIPQGQYAIQSPGDVVEMARSGLSSPSHSCGVGLHIGTWKYASTFGPITMTVRFSPRDVVSAPDGNSSWKLRVCRYTILDVIDNEGPLTSVVFRPTVEDDLDWCEDDNIDWDDDDPDFDLA